MAFYDLSKQKRADLVVIIRNDILQELQSLQFKKRLTTLVIMIRIFENQRTYPLANYIRSIKAYKHAL